MNKEIKDLDVFEAKLGSALRSTGHLFPTTGVEMDLFLEHSESGTVPEKYQTPDFILQEEANAPVKKMHIKTVDFTGAAQSWALAARNGKDLPQSILDKMKEDKKNSQKK